MASFNTVAGCVPASALFAMVCGKVSNALVHPHKLEKPAETWEEHRSDAFAWVKELGERSRTSVEIDCASHVPPKDRIVSAGFLPRRGRSARAA